MPFSFKPTIAPEATTNSLPQDGGASSSDNSSATSYRFANRETNSFQIGLFVTFGLVILGTVGLFGYQYFLIHQIDKKKVDLVLKEKELETLPLDDMRKLSNRIKGINKLIKDHVSVRVAFRIIEDSVKNSITYKTFDLNFDETENKYQLNLIGVADNYHALIQQMDILNSKTYAKYIPSITIESVQLNDTGGVDFKLKIPMVVTGILPEEVVLSSDKVSEGTSSVAIGFSSDANQSATSTTHTQATNKVSMPINASSTSDKATSSKVVVPKKP